MTRYRFVQRTRCPACSSTNVSVEYECSFANGPIAVFIARFYGVDPGELKSGSYKLVRCHDCTLLYQGWVGDAGFLADLYGEWINSENCPADDAQYQSIMAAPLQSRDGHEIMVISSYLGKPTERMVTLDYGMGWAMWARIARGLGCQSFGTELAPDRVAFAEEHDIEHIHDNDIGVGQFDFINTEQVFEHLPAPRDTAHRLTAALKPGGILKISVPRADRVEKLIKKLRANGDVPTDEEFVPAQPLEHVNSFSGRSLRKFAERLGLQQVRPSLLKRYAFLSWRGSVSLSRPKIAAKELARPFYTFNNPKNLYVWMQKLP